MPTDANNMRDSAATNLFSFMIHSEVGDVVMALTTTARRWFPLVAVSLLLVACNGEDPGSELPPGVTEGRPSIGPATAPPTTSASPTSTAVAASCPNEAAVAEDPARRTGTSIQADVNGDGSSDRIALASDPEGDDDCTTFVVVELGGGGTASAPVWEIGPEGGLPQPRLHGVTDIDGRAGGEVLVDEAAGASTQLVGAFVFVDNDLRRVTVDGTLTEVSGGSYEDLFPYGGSVGHVEAVDCVDEQVVVSVATPRTTSGAEPDYVVERRFFTFDGAELLSEETERSPVTIDELNRYPEFGSGPFASC